MKGDSDPAVRLALALRDKPEPYACILLGQPSANDDLPQKSRIAAAIWGRSVGSICAMSNRSLAVRMNGKYNAIGPVAEYGKALRSNLQGSRFDSGQVKSI
ncbi:hypothetical protein D3C87_1799710 [compost metagenome]